MQWRQSIHKIRALNAMFSKVLKFHLPGFQPGCQITLESNHVCLLYLLKARFKSNQISSFLWFNFRLQRTWARYEYMNGAISSLVIAAWYNVFLKLTSSTESLMKYPHGPIISKNTQNQRTLLYFSWIAL